MMGLIFLFFRLFSKLWTHRVTSYEGVCIGFEVHSWGDPGFRFGRFGNSTSLLLLDS